MCMEIAKENLLRINARFGGTLRSSSSLDFAVEMQKNKKIGNYKKLAYFFRAILVDHPFSDGNKRTALFLAYAFANEFNKSIDRDLLIQQIISIAKNNVQEISLIERRIKNAIK